MELTNAGTDPVNLLLLSCNLVSRVNPARFGMGPVRPMLNRTSDCRLVKSPMAVGMWEVLVHEDE
jgi:hypothetical protein